MRPLLATALAVAALVLAGTAPTTGDQDSAPKRAGANDPVMQTGFLFKTVRAGGETLKYAVYVPRDYAPEKKWPAIVFLHGSGESGTDGQKMIIQGIGSNILWHAERWPCIVMMPQKPVQQDQWERYDGAVMAMLEETKRAYAIDDSRIALTGLSQGGHGAWTIGAAHPEVWSAVAAVCGYAGDHGGGITPEEIAAKLKGVPMWVFHGADDDVVSPDESRRVVEAMKKAGADPAPKLTIYPKTNHGSWDKAYSEAELPAFLMRARAR